jgi:hypothetical protein
MSEISVAQARGAAQRRVGDAAEVKSGSAARRGLISSASQA